jgi:hypothetical protein
MSEAAQTTTRNIDAIVTEAISAYLGDISSLPRTVQSRIVDVYRDFFTAYVNIGRVKGISENDILEKMTEMDEDLINYMRHFFSDYQDLFRGFSDVNRHAKALMQIDGIRHPKKFNERADQLLAGRNPFNDDSVFNQLRLNLQADEQQKSD